MLRRRVFVTGMGCVSPVGDDPTTVFRRVYDGESAVRLVRSGGADFGAEVLLASVDFDPGDTIPKVRRVLMSRASQMAVVAAGAAVAQAGLSTDEVIDAGIYMGCGLGGSEALQAGYEVYYGRRSRRLRPATVPLIMAGGPAAHVGMRFGIRGPAHTYSIACASSAVALGEAFRAIRDGYLDVAVCGGAEAMLNDGTIAAWERLGVMATTHPEGPEASSRPFDAERTGFVLGEGAAVLVLESAEHAGTRGAEPVVEILGYGASSDAHSLTEPHVDGQARAIRAALADAEVSASSVDYVNAHATGTPSGDPVEIEAIELSLGRAAASVPISSTKSVHGHLVGASGALETMITALALDRRRIPPTANLTNPDPACGLDCVPLVGRDAPDIEVALTNSFAFGGSNATLVLKRA